MGKKASGIRGSRAPGKRIDKAFLGRLAFGPNPFGVPERRIEQAFLGRLAFGLSPIGVLGLGRLVRGTELGPMVPTTKKRGVSPILLGTPTSSSRFPAMDMHIPTSPFNAAIPSIVSYP